MELAKDFAIILVRIITIIPLMFIVTMLMGRRSIAQLPVFDFLIVITLGAIVGADLAVPETPHLPTIFAVVLVLALQVLVSKWHISNRTFGRLITFDPIIVVHNGTIIDRNLKKIRYSIDDLLQLLRGSGVFDLSDVEIAIIEANGQLTVHRKPGKESVTIEDLGLTKTSAGLAYPIIIDGQLNKKVLDNLSVREDWLYQELSNLNITDISTVFFASITEENLLHISLKENNMYPIKKLPPIFH